MSLTVAPAATAASNGLNAKIAFVSARDGNYEIYAMNSDGTGQTNLSNNSGGDIAPEWSPDGSKIAFTSFRDYGNAEIYVMNANGSGQTRLTNNSAVDSNPTWSPDGQKIAFRSDRKGGDFEIYTMNADGSGQTNLTNHSGLDDAPAWSPDGSTIAFETTRDGNYEIYTMSATGAGQTNRSNDPAADRDPTWSPNGQKIAFDASRDGNEEIYAMSAGGTGQTDLTTSTSDDSEAAWSPDGTKITFRSQRDGSAEIYVMTASDGSNQTRLTSNTAFDSNPSWQPSIPGFPRPKGATPLRASLAIAYKQCTNANSTHGVPLVLPSCNPPVQASRNLTVGTLDANGAAAGFVGFIALTVKVGQAGLPDDSDVLITASLTDVRCRTGVSTCEGGSLSDYTGQVRATTQMRITDKFNGLGPSGGFEPATVTEQPLSVTAQCTAVSGSVGASCLVNSSANAVVPGMIKDGKRQIMELGQVQVTDGGPDGLVSTASNDVFATEGLFVP